MPAKEREAGTLSDLRRSALVNHSPIDYTRLPVPGQPVPTKGRPIVSAAQLVQRTRTMGEIERVVQRAAGRD